MGRPNPFDNPELYDTVVTLSSQGRATLPGVSRVSVVGGIDEDVEDVAGEPGATVTVLGYRPKEVVITNTVWDKAGFDKIRAITELFEPVKGTAPEQIEVIHPILEANKVKRLYVFEVSTGEFNSRDGYVTTFRLREWFPKVTKSKKQGTTTLGTAGDGVNTDLSQFPTASDTPAPSSQGLPPPDRGGPS